MWVEHGHGEVGFKLELEELRAESIIVRPSPRTSLHPLPRNPLAVEPIFQRLQTLNIRLFQVRFPRERLAVGFCAVRAAHDPPTTIVAMRAAQPLLAKGFFGRSLDHMKRQAGVGK
jgi:hypothetical protein